MTSEEIDELTERIVSAFVPYEDRYKPQSRGMRQVGDRCTELLKLRGQKSFNQTVYHDAAAEWVRGVLAEAFAGEVS